MLLVNLIIALALSTCSFFEPAEAAQQGQPVQQGQGFISVEGADLRAKLEAAAQKGRSLSPQTRFWVAYSFDVRPRVAVDVEVGNFRGSMMNYDNMTIFLGKSGGQNIETRNLGVFVLYETDGKTPVRVEVYNLERKREYGGYPVYWLGRGGNEESMNFLRGLAETSLGERVVEHATVAVALHDDPRVSEVLKSLVRSSKNQQVRRTAVHWLGVTGVETGFLADLVRDEREDGEVRRSASHALGVSSDPASLQTLVSLYGTVADQEVKRTLIHSVSINSNQDPAIDFLIKLAKTERDTESRSQALFWLGHKAGEKALGVLKDTVEREDADTEVQKHAVFVISRRPADEAVPLLIKIARTHAKPEVRKQAIFWLGRTGDDRALAFFEEILGK
ncbi:MAG TPA: HEAT repeat domain-containing protein [Pyrinomonadaceae bacterium]|nr:HEAT repeat domain-containing protein [Pyrinomonadaceae bacterium]